MTNTAPDRTNIMVKENKLGFSAEVVRSVEFSLFVIHFEVAALVIYVWYLTVNAHHPLYFLNKKARSTIEVLPTSVPMLWIIKET